MTPSQPIPSPSHPFARRVLRSLGWLALAAFVALLSPGVVTFASAEALVSALPEGPSCSADGPGDAEQVSAQLAHWIEQVRAQTAQGGHGPEVQGDVVLLNGRGYNYGPAPSPDPGLIEAERRLH